MSKLLFFFGCFSAVFRKPLSSDLGLGIVYVPGILPFRDFFRGLGLRLNLDLELGVEARFNY